MSRRRRRTIDEVVEDDLWPSRGGASLPDPTMFGRRETALEEVLTTLPDEVYEELKKRCTTFRWFVPYPRERGLMTSFPAVSRYDHQGEVLTALVVYLSPRLESDPIDVVVGVVAHELAHVILDHKIRPEHYDQQEAEVRSHIKAWGYAAEDDALDACHKREDDEDEADRQAAIRELFGRVDRG